MGSIIVLGVVVGWTCLVWAWRDVKMEDRHQRQIDDLLGYVKDGKQGELEAIGNMVRKMMFGYDDRREVEPDDEAPDEDYEPVNERIHTDADWIREQTGLQRLHLVGPFGAPTEDELRKFIPHEDDPFMDDGDSDELDGMAPEFGDN